MASLSQDHQPPPPQPPSTDVSPPITATATTSTAPPKPDSTPPKPDPPDFVTVPSYSSWFKWNEIHECEVRHMPEFFEGKPSPSKNPIVYKYYRDAIVSNFRSHPSRKLTFTEARRTLVGDAGSIRRVFDFLDTWGLINYSPPSGKPPFKWEDKIKDKDKDKDSAAKTLATTTGTTSATATKNTTNSHHGNGGVPDSGSKKSSKFCSACKVVCTIACFVSDKHDLVLCARCYVRGNYQAGVNSSEFRRVEISEPAKTDWTDKETLQLLEAVMHYRDDWKRVAEHVGGRTEKECVARFIKLPFWEQFAEPADMGEEVGNASKDQVNADSESEPPAKRIHLSPLADASNPIMAQAAFLSALAGIEASEAAARAAVATLNDTDRLTSRSSGQTQTNSMKVQDPSAESGGGPITCTPEEARVEAESQLKQEEDEFLKSIANIIGVKMKEILDKIDRYEAMDLQLEREWHQLFQMKHQLFLDKITLLFKKAAVPKSAENVSAENGRTKLT